MSETKRVYTYDPAEFRTEDADRFLSMLLAGDCTIRAGYLESAGEVKAPREWLIEVLLRLRLGLDVAFAPLPTSDTEAQP